MIQNLPYRHETDVCYTYASVQIEGAEVEGIILINSFDPKFVVGD